MIRSKLFAWLILGCLTVALPVLAKSVKIADIPHAEDIEVMQVKDGAYVYLPELGALKFPLRATQKADGSLEFKAAGITYNITRANVRLVGEKLVNDACKTVPVTLVADARSLSVKGAGEGCK